MINDKLSAEKIILVMVILIALGMLGYSIALKNVLPVAVSPTVSPTLNPTPESVITPTPVATIIPTPTPNIDVSDWRTYRNEEFGFEIKYPKEYESNEDYAIWTLTNKGGVLSEWGVNKRQETVFGIDVYLKNEKTRLLNHFGNETVADQRFFINDIAAKKLEGGKTAWNVLMIENENYIYIIISSFSPFKNNQEYNEYKAILSTFKFTEKDKTIDWETYRNEKFGYSIKYPIDWYLYSDNSSDVFFQPNKEKSGGAPGPHSRALEITVTSIKNGYDPIQAVKPGFDQAGISFTEESVIIGGITGLKVVSVCDGVGCGTPEWLVVKDNYLYHFISNLGYNKIFDQIISTFEFIK